MYRLDGGIAWILGVGQVPNQEWAELEPKTTTLFDIK